MGFDPEEKVELSARYASRVTAQHQSPERRYETSLGALANLAGVGANGAGLSSALAVADEVRTGLLRLADPAWVAARRDALSDEVLAENLAEETVRTEAHAYLNELLAMSIEVDELRAFTKRTLLELKHRGASERQSKESPAGSAVCEVKPGQTGLEEELTDRVATLTSEVLEAEKRATKAEALIAAFTAAARHESKPFRKCGDGLFEAAAGLFNSTPGSPHAWVVGLDAGRRTK